MRNFSLRNLVPPVWFGGAHVDFSAALTGGVGDEGEIGEGGSAFDRGWSC